MKVGHKARLYCKSHKGRKQANCVDESIKCKNMQRIEAAAVGDASIVDVGSVYAYRCGDGSNHG